MTNGAEKRLALLASRIAIADEAKRELRQLLSASVNWPELLRFAVPHGIVPLISHNLREIAPDLTPPAIMRKLNAYAMKLRERNSKAAGELVEVLEALSSKGVTAVPFKGAVLQFSVYQEPGLREFADLDLMVSPGELADSIAVLQSLDYGLQASQRGRPVSRLLREGVPLDFAREGRLTIDLHWRFATLGFDFDLRPELLVDDVETIEIHGQPVPTYSMPIVVLLLCTHQARHRWRRLNWLCDIAALLNSHPTLDWTQVLKNARELRCERIVLATFMLANRLLGADLPEAIVRPATAEPGRVIALAEKVSLAILEGGRRDRWLYLEMREGHPLSVAARYFTTKLRDLLA